MDRDTPQSPRPRRRPSRPPGGAIRVRTRVLRLGPDPDETPSKDPPPPGMPKRDPDPGAPPRHDPPVDPVLPGEPRPRIEDPPHEPERRVRVRALPAPRGG